MATELGTAYISIVGETSKLRKDIQSALNGVEKAGATQGRNYGTAFGSGAGTALSSAGGSAAGKFTDSFQREANTRATRIGSAVGTLLGGAVVGAAGVAVAGLGAILFKGLDRYKSIDKTAKRLGAMGKTTDQIKTVMDGINDAIKGTPIALDEAADSATKFLSGGVKEGKPLNDIMLAIADSAGASGQSFGDLATIFGQVMNKGKLQAEEMNQLNERGINIQAALRDKFGYTKDELTKLSAEGKISFDQLLQAVEGSFGGMAKAAGNSIDGAISNVKTSVARLGANFLSAIFGDPLSTTEGPGAMAEAINNIGKKIDGLNTWVTAHQGEIKQFFTDAAETAKTLAGAVGNVLGFLKEHPAAIGAVVVAFGAWKTIEGVAALTTALQTVSTLMKVTLPADAAVGGAAVGANFTKGLSAAGFLLRAGVWTLPAAIAYSIIFGDPVNNPQTQTSGGPGQPQLPGFGGSGQSPTGIPSAAQPGLFSVGPSATGTPGPRVPGSGNAGPGAPLASYGPLIGGGGAPPSPASVAGIAKAQALNGLPYTPGTTDCSGYVSQVYSAMVGRNVHFTTMADFEALGFKRGYMPGALNIGNTPKPGNAGHMAATLPNGVNIESGGGSGSVSYGSGPGAMGEQFAEQWYFMPGFATGGAVGTAFIDRNQDMWFGPGVPNLSNEKGGHEQGPTRGGSWGKGKPFFRPGQVPWWDLGIGRATGGGIRGAGSGTSDSIPAWLSNGEHVLTANDVAAMGGQSGVYAFRNSLHRKGGGEIATANILDTQYRNTQLSAGVGRMIGHPWWWMRPTSEIDSTGKGPYRGSPKTVTFPKDVTKPNDIYTRNRRGVQGWGFAKGGPVGPWQMPFGDEKAGKGPYARNLPGWWLRILQRSGGIPINPTKPGAGIGQGPKGGFWNPGLTPSGFAEGGAVGSMLGGSPPPKPTPEQLAQLQQAGIDPASVPPEQLPQVLQQLPTTMPTSAAGDGSMPARTEGYIPAAAANTGKTGGGVAGSLIGLGGEAAKGAIQMAADMGKMAASMGAPGGGAGAGAGIQMGADIAKRGVDYGVDMANIGVGALSEILLPFGAPRWLSDVDPTSFMPHSGVQGAATTTAEDAVLKQQGQTNPELSDFANDPNAHGMSGGAAPGPPVEPANINTAPMVQIGEINGMDPNKVGADIAAQQRLLVMQYGGRPYG